MWTGKTRKTTTWTRGRFCRMKKSPIVTVRDLAKRYDDIVAVDDISFEVRQGELFGMVGPNGRSK